MNDREVSLLHKACMLLAMIGLNISKKQRRLFDVWNRVDPVDAWEVWRNKRIMALQGNSNPYVGRFAASVKTLKRTE
ncbi:MAG: endonuclease [Mariprofundus sp.]|nr:endonuclease [Mariprofundus sp.]